MSFSDTLFIQVIDTRASSYYGFICYLCSGKSIEIMVRKNPPEYQAVSDKREQLKLRLTPQFSPIAEVL